MRNARQRIEGLSQSVGVDHPEYASGLNQLALLLIMQGDPTAAEPLLRRALDIRRASLGVEHPDYATNLSSLGGLLWARGALDEAEGMLRQAAGIRVKTLGASHPKTVVSLNSLDQLAQAREQAAREEAVPVLDAPFPVADAPERASLDAFRAGVRALTPRFEGLGTRLEELAAGLARGVIPPVDDLLSRLGETRGHFERLRQQALGLGEALGVAVEPSGLTSLDELMALVPSLHDAIENRGMSGRVRRAALERLDRIDHLSCPTDPTLPELGACRALAHRLRGLVEASTPGELPSEVRALAEGAHPLAALLELTRADDRVSDAQWADWYDAVESSLGAGLAVAVARGRIVDESSAAGAAS